MVQIRAMTTDDAYLRETQDLAHAMGIPTEVVNQAAASGIDLPTLLKWVAMYGLPIITWLAQVFGWKLPPLPPFPVPPLPTPMV